LIVVLDASAAVRAVMDPGSVFQTPLHVADLVIAPELIVAEVCSAFRKYVRARVVSRMQAEESIDRALALVDKMHPLQELVPEVLALAWRNDSSVYDLFYLALALQTGATLLTADLALRKAALGLGLSAGAT